MSNTLYRLFLPFSAILILVMMSFSDIKIFAQDITPSTAVSVQQTGQGCGQSVVALLPGQTIPCAITPNESHQYTIENLEIGEYIHIEVEQRHVDVILTLTGPGNFEAQRNWPSVNQGFEYLSFVVSRPGTYRLMITVDPNTKPEPGSDYLLLLSERKKPSPEDLSRAKAEELFDRGREQKEVAERIDLLGQAVSEWRKSGDRYGLATGLSSWGFARGGTDEVFTNREELLKIYSEALGIWEVYNQLQRQIQLLLYIARVHDVNAQLGQSVEYYKQALTLYERPETPKSPILQATILNNLGTAQHRLEDEEDAIDSLKEAIAILHGIGQDKSEAIANNNLGQLYAELGRFEDAERHFRRAQEIRGNKDFDPASWATTRHNQGGLEAKRGNLSQAEAYLREALEIRKKGPREFETLHLLAYVLNLQENPKEALTLYEKVLPFVERRPAEKIVTLLNIGRIYDSDAQGDRALTYYRQAFDLLSSIDSPALEWQILFALGRSERDHKLLESAAEHLGKAFEIILKQSKRRINLNVRALYLANTRTVAETYVDTLMRLSVERSDVTLRDKAFEISEQARARSLIELLKESKVSLYKDVEPDLLERASNLETELNAADYVRQERQFNQASPILQKAAQSRVNKLTLDLEALDTKIRRANKRFADLFAVEPFTLRDLAKTLDSNTVALEFLLGDKQSYAWLVSSAGIIAFEPLPPGADVEKMARKYYEMLRDEEQNFAGLGRRLNEILLQPFADKIRGKNLIIIPDGALHYVPFSALPTVGAEGSATTNSIIRYVVERQSITVLPSLSTLKVQRDARKSRPSSPQALAVFADPVYDVNDPPHGCENRKVRPKPKRSSVASVKNPTQRAQPAADLVRGGAKNSLKYPRLFQTQKEMSALLALSFRGQKYRACGFDANARHANSRFLSPFRFIHFAVHSTIDSEHPELSGLVLSLFDQDGNHTPEGILRLSEVYRLNLQSDLVVLSACETIQGKEIRGEGIVGLTRGFMAAGAERVVTSLWKVSDQPVTVDLMKYFYQGILDRRRQLVPAMALQEAQKRVLAEHPGLHPRYWAAFTIEGEFRGIPNP